MSRSWTGAGLALSGSVSFAREEGARRAGAWPLVYVPCEPPRRAPPAKDKRPLEDYQDAYKDFITTWLPKLEGEKLEQVYEELTEKFPDYLGAHIAYLNAIDSPTDHKKLPHADAEPDVTKAFCEQIIAIADKVISQIDQEKLLAYLGTKNDTRSDAAKIKQEQERRRGLLVEALSRRGAALVRLRAPLATRALQDLLKYADLTDAKAIQYGVWQCFGAGHWARAARLLARLQEERPSRDLEDRLLQAYRKLGWEYMASFAEAALPVKYPASYRPF